MEISQRFKTANMNLLDFLLEEPPASPSRSLDSEAAWTMNVATWHSNSANLLIGLSPSGWCGRMSPVSCHRTADGTLAPSSGRWSNSGMVAPTQSLTLNTLEYRNGAVASSLSDILETGDVPQRYFLTPLACRGILRRAEKRGKKLPMELEMALRERSEHMEPKGGQAVAT